MTTTEPIYDFIILGVPDDVSLDDPEKVKILDLMAERNVMLQYKGRRPKALVMDKIRWYITSDWQEVARTQPDHDCASCRAGNDQAIAFLKEHPDKKLALGNLKYYEVW